jgi:peroxiredoxin
MRTDDVVFLGVNDEDQQTIQGVTQALGLNFFTILDNDNSISSEFGVEVVPYTVVIGRNGNIVATVRGFDGSEDRVRSSIEQALAASPEPGIRACYKTR